MLQSWLSAFPKSAAGRETALGMLGNSGWLLADRLFRAAVGLVLVVWLARHLGPSQFGIYSYALAFVGLFVSIASLGVDTILVRELVNKPSQGPALVGAAVILKLAGGALAFSIAVISIAILRAGNQQIIVLVAIAATSFVFQAGDAVDAWNQSQKNNRRSVAVRSSVATFGAIAKAASILTGASVDIFVAISSMEAIAVSLLLLAQYGVGRLRFQKQEFRILAKGMLALSWPFIFSGIAISTYMRIDQIIIGYLLTDADVGNYGAATRLSEVWYLLPTVITTAASPHLLALFSQSKERFTEYLTSLVRAFLIISISIAAAVSIFSTAIVSLIFGPGFQESSSILTVHIWSGVFVFVGLASTIWMLANGYAKYSLFQTIMGAVLNILLNFLLIPRMGAVGAAWATLFSYALANYAINACFGFSRPLFHIVTSAFIGPLAQSSQLKR